MENATPSIPYDARTVIQLSWIALLVFATAATAFTIPAIVVFKRVPQGMNPAYAFTQLFVRAKALQMVTVILIVWVVALLALLHSIDSNGAVGILSGIAGYVLGGLQKEPAEAALRKEKGASQDLPKEGQSDGLG
jgi:hypothetical protein